MASTNTVDDIATYLKSLGLGVIDPETLVADDWEITKRYFSQQTDRNIMVSTDGGAPIQEASLTKNPTIDIFIRCGNDEVGALETKATAIIDALAAVSEVRIAGGTMYNMIRSLQSEAVNMGKDEKRRPVFLTKFEALRSTINSAP